MVVVAVAVAAEATVVVVVVVAADQLLELRTEPLSSNEINQSYLNAP